MTKGGGKEMLRRLRMKNVIGRLLTAALVFANACVGNASNDVTESSRGFLTAENNGKICQVSFDGKIQEIDTGIFADFFCVSKTKDGYIAGGEGGICLVSEDEINWDRYEYSFKESIVDIEYHEGINYFLCDNGTIYFEQEPENGLKKCPQKLDGTMIGMATCKYGLIAAAADSSYIFYNGDLWEKHNFNEEYKNYASEITVTGVGNTDQGLWILGYNNKDKHPIAMSTVDGHTWSNINMKIYDGDGNSEYVVGIPTGMIYSSIDNQILITLDNGELLTITGCSQCNMLTKLSDSSLKSGAFSNGFLYIYGENNYSKIIDCIDVRQNSMAPEQALKELEQGAVLIDVRSENEYRKEHITGASNIYLDNLKEELPLLVTDKETTILFYCTKGIKSKEAVSEALNMGYMHSYSIGGIEQWPYKKIEGEEVHDQK